MRFPKKCLVFSMALLCFCLGAANSYASDQPSGIWSRILNRLDPKPENCLTQVVFFSGTGFLDPENGFSAIFTQLRLLPKTGFVDHHSYQFGSTGPDGTSLYFDVQNQDQKDVKITGYLVLSDSQFGLLKDEGRRGCYPMKSLEIDRVQAVPVDQADSIGIAKQPFPNILFGGLVFLNSKESIVY